MRLNLQTIAVLPSDLLNAAVIALCAVFCLANSAPPHGVTPVRRPAAEAALLAPVSSSSANVRMETVTYDAWTVTCRDTADGKSKKICSASLPMVVEQQNQRINLGGWVIAYNNEGALQSVVQTPEVDVGVLVGKGVDLKFGNGKPRKINFVDCNPQHCEASSPMDEALTREALTAANGPATVTFWKADGASFNINIQSIKGIDKALAALKS